MSTRKSHVQWALVDKAGDLLLVAISYRTKVHNMGKVRESMTHHLQKQGYKLIKFGIHYQYLAGGGPAQGKYRFGVQEFALTKDLEHLV